MLSIHISCCNIFHHDTCCICYQKKKVAINCKHCVEGIVCVACIGSLTESGFSNLCPICRNPDWKNTIISKKTIVPITPIEITNTSEVINSTSEVRNFTCDEIFKISTLVASYMFISFVLGFFVVQLFDKNGSVTRNPALFWIQLPIGFILMTCICCGCKNCIQDMDR